MVQFRIPGMLRNVLRPLRSITLAGPREDWRAVHSVGRETYGVPKILVLGSESKLKVGSFCSIAVGVEIFLGGEHRPDWVSTYPFNSFPERWPSARHNVGHPRTRGDVVIGNDVWIGQGAVIRSGVTIGDGACIGMRSVVTKSIPPYCIAAGNPARVVRQRFSDAQVARLLEIRWWDWSDVHIAAATSLLQSANLEGLFDYADALSRDRSVDTSSG